MKCILFDLDGTLIDSEKLAAAAMREGFRSILNREASEEELAILKGKPLAKVMLLLYPEDGANILKAATLYYNANSSSIVLFDGVIDMLEDLARNGYELGVVSAKTRVNVLKELENSKIKHFFSCIIGQEDTKFHKPSPVPLQLAAAMIGYRAEECAYIGDQPTDMIAASAAGMVSGAALWGDGRRDILSTASPDEYFETPHEVVQYFCNELIMRHPG
ncbi:HAD family hydrolase [Paenibacillus sp. L3-i20]|uniref:HAD family hydrolase n=1 Tax=Paenibacillus sp. L3-i20 TaxID=2905833 RepID=UPI001EE108F5|nr:HAD family hydrolase [Paenibacillus sp. L3-i20]GKU79762.1 pyrophosphatase PpaX [Paenibacillus sp. L3-i20]